MLALLSILLASSLASAQTRAREPLSLEEGRSVDTRIEADSKALVAKPSDNRLTARLALDYIRKMRETVDFSYLDRAAKLVDAVLERDAGNYEALRLRTEIDMERHNFARVAEYSSEMTRFAPNDPGAWGSLGDARMELGEYAAAGEAYNKMIALRPDLPSYNRLAWYRFVTGDAPGAIATVRSAIEAGSPQPENIAWCWADLGGILWKTGNGDGALSAFRKALQTFPGYYPALAGLGRIAAARNQLAAAIESLRQAQRTVPLPEYAQALEDVYARAGDAEKAKSQRALLGAIEITMRASGEKTNRNMALLLADQNRSLDRALQLVSNEIAVRPDVYTHDALAWVLFRLGKLDEARAETRKALALGTPEPTFHFHAAMIADAQQDRATASEEFRAALALNSSWDFAQSALAREKLSAFDHASKNSLH